MTFFEDEDFVSVVSSSNSRKVEVVEMKNADVLNWKDGQGRIKTALGPGAMTYCRAPPSQ